MCRPCRMLSKQTRARGLFQQTSIFLCMGVPHPMIVCPPWNVPWGSSEHLLSWWAQVGRMCATVLKPARSQPYFTVCCSSLTYMLGTRFFVNRVLCKAHQLRRILPSSTASQIRFDTIIFDRVLSWAISERLLHPVRWQRLRNL